MSRFHSPLALNAKVLLAVVFLGTMLALCLRPSNFWHQGEMLVESINVLATKYPEIVGNKVDVHKVVRGMG